MEIVKAIWAVNFFFFSLILFFVWSKIYIIAKRIKKAAGLIEEIDKIVSGESTDSGAKPA